MSRRNLGVRALLLFVGLPVFFALIYLFPQHRHLGLNLGAVAATVVGALETERLTAAKGAPRLRALAVSSGLIPAAAYLEVLGLQVPGFSGASWVQIAATTLLSIALLSLLRATRREHLPPLVHQASASFLVVLYPALFVSFIVRISGLPQATLALFFFFALNFGNDILAYLFGTFLGGRTRLGYPISPNKSIVGFAAGLAGSIGVALLFRRLFPGFFPVSFATAAVFGLAVGALTVAGDLVESALKRSAEVKDSGGVIPGRGGVLDSIDSWLLSAPLFYFVFRGISGYIGG